MRSTFIFSCLLVAANAAPSPNNGRIVNGENAAEGQFPYEISLRIEGHHICGGSILDETTILSAAHCVHLREIETLAIYLGSIFLSEQTEVHQVASIKIHPQYNTTNFPYEVSNDLSIIKLKTPILFRDGVRPLKLRQTDIGVEDVIISGWGSTYVCGNPTNTLQLAKMKTLTVEDCRKEHTLPIFDTSLCAYSKPGQGACHGDSGSPLVDLNGEQVGIASWVKPCAVGKPDVYARIYSFLNWIEENRHSIL